MLFLQGVAAIWASRSKYAYIRSAYYLGLVGLRYPLVPQNRAREFLDIYSLLLKKSLAAPIALTSFQDEYMGVRSNCLKKTAKFRGRRWVKRRTGVFPSCTSIRRQLQNCLDLILFVSHLTYHNTFDETYHTFRYRRGVCFCSLHI